MSDFAQRITENSLNDQDLSLINQCQNGAEIKANVIQYLSCSSDFYKIQQKKQFALALSYNKKLLKLAIYSKCQVIFSNWLKYLAQYLIIGVNFHKVFICAYLYL